MHKTREGHRQQPWPVVWHCHIAPLIGLRGLQALEQELSGDPERVAILFEVRRALRHQTLGVRRERAGGWAAKEVTP
jgi:hypothetical protein